MKQDTYTHEHLPLVAGQVLPPPSPSGVAQTFGQYFHCLLSFATATKSSPDTLNERVDITIDIFSTVAVGDDARFRIARGRIIRIEVSYLIDLSLHPFRKL